jgi:hypothetical protein
MGAFFNIGPIGGLVAGVLRSGEPVLVFPRDRALNRIKENRLDAGRKSTRRAEPNEVRAAERVGSAAVWSKIGSRLFRRIG